MRAPLDFKSLNLSRRYTSFRVFTWIGIPIIECCRTRGSGNIARDCQAPPRSLLIMMLLRAP